MTLRQFNLARVHALLYLLTQKTKTVNEQFHKHYMYLMKLLFIAERWHLRKAGTLLVFDNHIGMKNGSVLSRTLNYLKEEVPRLSGYDVEIKKTDYQVSKLAQLSVDFAVEKFGKFSQYQLGDITHSYPEWDLYEHELEGSSKYFNEKAELFFDDPNTESKNFKFVQKYFGGKDPFKADREFLNSLREDFITTSRSDSLAMGYPRFDLY